MILRLYSLFMRIVQPFMLRKLRRRAVAEPGYGVAVQERLGDYAPVSAAPPISSRETPLVWVHAVSLGETLAAAALIDRLREALPGMRLLLTHGTATGRAQGAKLLRQGDVQVWQPWDTPAAVARFLVHFKPTVGILIETEIWPNLVAQCRQRGVPLCLANARLSEKSLRQAQRLAWLARPAYQGLRAVWAQAPADAQRLRALGAPLLGVLGNFKFDVQPNPALLAQGRAWRAQHAAPVVVLAVSREGEEELLLQSLQRRAQDHKLEENQAADHTVLALPAIENIANKVQWMIVPRHPQRFDAVAQLCESYGFTVRRRSQWGTEVAGNAEPAPQAPANANTAPEKALQAVIWLGDTLGEMALYYGLSDIALLGGSFAPLGGQNLIEAAACGCPVVMGPHTFNFAQAAELARDAGAAWQVADMQAAVDTALALAANAPALHSASHSASALAQAHQGAGLRTAQAIHALLLEDHPDTVR